MENQRQESVQEVKTISQKPNNFLISLLSILLLIACVISGFFVYQTKILSSELKLLQDQINNQTATPEPESVFPMYTEPSAIPTNWKTYTNKVHNITFKYPSDWILNTISQGDVVNKNTYNTIVELRNNNSIMKVILNLDGIGGIGQALSGQPITILGRDLYRYETENTFNKTLTYGITDNLKQSLGVFKVNDNVYSITLSIPISYSSGEQFDAVMVFDQILSTFKFID